MIIGGLSGLIFTMIVMVASFITTYFVSAFEEPSHHYYSSLFYVSPIEIAQDLVRAVFRILQDEDASDIIDETVFQRTPRSPFPPHVGSLQPMPTTPSGIFMRFVRRFVLGLPLVGAGSLVHMLLSVGLLGPVHWLARYRGRNRRRGNSRDIAAIIIVALIIAGAARSAKHFIWLSTTATRHQQGIIQSI